MTEVFRPVISEIVLPPDVHFNAQVNRVGEGVLATLEAFTIHPYGACEGCVRNACDTCGAGGLYARVTFAPLEGDRFVTRLWAPQIAPLARLSRSQLIRTWRITPAELDARLQAYIGLPFLLAGLTLRVEGAITHAVARLTCIPWEVVRAEMAARQAKQELEARATQESPETGVQRANPRRRRPLLNDEPSLEEIPINLDPQTRNYYKETWGFDPVTDRVNPPAARSGRRGRRGGILYYYDADIPLESDPELVAAGVSMHARVEVGGAGDPHNRLIFMRGSKNRGVECIHTIIYRASLSELAELTKEDYSEMVQTAPGRHADIPPWEHFAALKSFAGGLAAAGILNVLLPDNLGGQEQEPAPLEMNTALMKQLREALQAVASDVALERTMVMQGSLIEQADVEWLQNRWSLLHKAYGLNAVFKNALLVASMSTETQLKLLRIFLSFSHKKVESVAKVGAKFLPVVLTPANIDSITDFSLLYKALFAICLSWGPRTWARHEEVPRLIIKRALKIEVKDSSELKQFLEIFTEGAPTILREKYLLQLVQEFPSIERLM